MRSHTRFITEALIGPCARRLRHLHAGMRTSGRGRGGRRNHRVRHRAAASTTAGLGRAHACQGHTRRQEARCEEIEHDSSTFLEQTVARVRNDLTHSRENSTNAHHVPLHTQGDNSWRLGKTCVRDSSPRVDFRLEILKREWRLSDTKGSVDSKASGLTQSTITRGEHHASMRENRITKSRPSSGGAGWKLVKTGEV